MFMCGLTFMILKIHYHVSMVRNIASILFPFVLFVTENPLRPVPSTSCNRHMPKELEDARGEDRERYLNI